MFRKRNTKINKYFESFKKSEEKWNRFKKTEQYLISIEKEKYISVFSNNQKFSFLDKILIKLNPDFKEQYKQTNDLMQEVFDYNKTFIEKSLSKNESFLCGKDDGLEFGLDPAQKIAVIKNDKHNLVVAGAGSGKTSVLTTKIAYLIKKDHPFDTNRILALAFTNTAAEEMRKRLKKKFKIDIEIKTFHSLGLKILRDEMPVKPKIMFSENSERLDFINKEFNKKIEEDSKFRTQVFNYLVYHAGNEEPENSANEESFAENKELYYEYMRNKQYMTLNGIDVKSYGERMIGNFLFTNNIKFQYEPTVDWILKTDIEDAREYHPDYYLPDYDIYIEYWGMDEHGNVPDWFSISSEEYNQQREWKLSQYKTQNKKLLEFWDFERRKGTLIKNLKEKLYNNCPEILFQQLSLAELIEKVTDARLQHTELINSITQFINTAKSNSLMVDDIKQKLRKMDRKKIRTSHICFYYLAIKIYETYQNHLTLNNGIDFNDMINLSVKFAELYPEKYLTMFDFVLVDEFQDISFQRLELLKCFVSEQNKTRLFCVGDDWQSIYQFTGSEVSFFVNFSKYFSAPAITKLEQNYRCYKSIVTLSNNLIANNKDQIKKNIHTNRSAGPEPLLIQLPWNLNNDFKSRTLFYYNYIKTLIKHGVNTKDIMVLSRYNRFLNELKIFCGGNGLPTDGHRRIKFLTAHSSKGGESKHVIIIDVVRGIYGFPSERKDMSVMDLAKRFPESSNLEEERRLFYVAVTRAQKFLHIFTIENNQSTFIKEIEPYTNNISLLNLEDTKILNEFLYYHLKEKKSKLPYFCPNCGRPLRKTKSRHGDFLRCLDEENCGYNISTIPQIYCHNCEGFLIKRNSKFGPFLGCSNYPKCKYTEQLIQQPPRDCPECGNRLVKKKGKYGYFYGCKGYPYCKFIFHPRKDFESDIICQNCGRYLNIKQRGNTFIIKCKCGFSKTFQ